MENKIWIRIEFNDYCLMEGRDELIAELKKVCPVQVRKKWYPSFCTGMEFFLSLNFNLNLVDFVNNVIIPGAELWALQKVCGKIWSAFKTFLEKNEDYDIQQLDLTYDDVVIRFKGSPNYVAMLQFYQTIAHHLQVLKHNEINNIFEISLPYAEIEDDENGSNIIREIGWDYPDADLLWKVKYLLGCETCYYNPAKEIVVI